MSSVSTSRSVVKCSAANVDVPNERRAAPASRRTAGGQQVKNTMPRTDHVAFAVSNLDESIKFYTEKLGLRLMFRKVDVAEQEDFAYFELEGGNLELLQSLNGQPFVRAEIQPPYCPHLALTTDDLDSTLKLIETQQLRLIRGPLELEGAARWLYVADPDNNVIEFVQWLSK
jgi:catechol 2,3-dioxygenase-like lactoylglutathione lyase family enzyme